MLDKALRLDRPVKRVIQVVADVVLIVACFAVAMALRLEGFSFAANPRSWVILAIVLPVTIFGFARLGLYHRVIRYISSRALRVVFSGVLMSAATMALADQLLVLPVPRSVPAIYALLLLASVGGVRYFFRALVLNKNQRNRIPVLIYGAGEAGRQLVNAVNQGPECYPVAFVDDDSAMHNMIIAGIRVHAPSAIRDLVETHAIKRILLALPSISRARRRSIVESLEDLPVVVLTVPGMADIVSGKVTFNDLTIVSPEDLLGRDPVEPRADLMAANITGKVVMVSGAGGSIGSELARQVLALSPSVLVLLDVSEFALYKIDDELQPLGGKPAHLTQVVPILGSVQNPSRMRAIMRAFKVQTVYHAAAYKHVPLVEENVVEGVRNNVFGTRAIAEAAAETGVEAFIMISTDKAVRPTNIMGASKRMAELVCQTLAQTQSGTIYSMVRFGNVLGSSGSVIPRFRAQIERGGPVTVTHLEITRFFMTIPEAAQLVIQAGAMAKGGDVFVLDMGEPVKIMNLAKSMIRLCGLVPFVINDDGQADGAGDIAIRTTGLRPGEKLYEELLIGDNPSATEHSRIMSAQELSLEAKEMNAHLNDLMAACTEFDIPRIREILLQAPTGYQPSDDIADFIWNASSPRLSAAPTTKVRLQVVCDGLVA